jgi:uncharacterized lipoprotein YajG
MKKSIIPLAAVLALATAGCGRQPQPQQQPPAPPPRPETKAVEASSLVGYDGKAIRSKVDNVLNKNDERNKDLDDAMKQQESAP